MSQQENLTIEAPAEETGPGYDQEGNPQDLPPIVPEKVSGYAGGKFQSVEELEAAYAELAQKSAEPDSQAEAKPLDPASLSDAELTRERAEQELAAKSGGQLEIGDMEREFMENGMLSEATYQKLEQNGIPREVTDRYINANVQAADAYAMEVKAIAGGEAEYAEMSEWAGKNLSPEEVTSFNSMVSSGDTSLVKLAVQGMTARWRDAVGQPPQLVSGAASAQAPAPSGFKSAQEMMQAMRDPRYGVDPAFTHSVEQMVLRSNIF